MKNKINEIIVAHNEELSSELILQYLKEKKVIQIKSEFYFSNPLSPIDLEKLNNNLIRKENDGIICFKAKPGTFGVDPNNCKYDK